MSYGYGPYVNKATKQKSAAKEVEKMRKKGVKASPIVIAGRAIAKSVWGKAWCDALESHADAENRLARGRTYARNGSIVHLEASENKVTAKVAGSRLYSVDIDFEELANEKWKRIRDRCKGHVSSLVDLLSGKVPATVMALVSEKNQGLFPNPGQMKFNCSCPDWASMCKHVAAVLYGVGSRLDSEPELLFSLRGVNHLELIPEIKDIVGKATKNSLSDDEIEDVFGIDFAPVLKAKNLDEKAKTSILTKAPKTQKKIPLKLLPVKTKPKGEPIIKKDIPKKPLTDPKKTSAKKVTVSGKKVILKTKKKKE